MWRATGDIWDSWTDGEKSWQNGIQTIIDLARGLEGYAGPGHWNDPDMLLVGNGGMNVTEYRAHFSLWCLLAAPLMAACDLRSMDAGIREILTNIRDQLSVVRKTPPNNPDTAAADPQDHFRILAAIRRHDPDEAEQIMRRHIRAMRGALAGVLR